MGSTITRCDIFRTVQRNQIFFSSVSQLPRHAWGQAHG